MSEVAPPPPSGDLGTLISLLFIFFPFFFFSAALKMPKENTGNDAGGMSTDLLSVGVNHFFSIYRFSGDSKEK